MTYRHRKALLIAANALWAATLLACAWGGVLAPLRTADPDRLEDPTRDPATRTAEEGIAPRAAYEVIYARPLRKPLYDPKPRKVTKAPRPEPTFDGVLAGTILEPGFTYALFRTPKGEEAFVGVGQSFAGAEVLAIAAGEVTVRFHGKQMTLKVQEDRP